MKIITDLTRGMTIKQKKEFKTNAKAFGKELLYCLGGVSIFFLFFVIYVIIMLYIKSLS